MKKALSLVLPLLALNAFAEEEKAFQLDAEVGALMTSGNTKSTAFKGKVDAKQDLSSWRTQYVLEGLYKEDEVDNTEGGILTSVDQTTAQKYFASAQADYKLNEEHRGLFIFGSYEDDRFSGYDYQSTIAVGYSDRLFKTDNSHLDYSVGPGYTTNKSTLTGETDSNVIIRLAASYVYKFSPNAKFTQTMASNVATDADSNTATKAESAITATLTSSFAIKASYTINHNSEVPEGIETTDTQTAVTLVYSL